MIAIAGAGSEIAKALLTLIPPEETVLDGKADELPGVADRYLFCAGYLAGKKIGHASELELAETWDVNFYQPVKAIDRILAINRHARIAVVGSESAYTGSFDMAYAGAKAALHTYVETKRLPHADQQLFAVAPTIIGDAGMTTRRSDLAAVARRAELHPKGRWLSSLEVARLIHFGLYVDAGYLSGIVIRLNGGEHATA